MKLSDIAKRMLLVICISLPLLIAGAFAYYRSLNFLYFALGALLGTILNAAKVILIERTAKKLIGMEKERAANYARIQGLLRFLLTGIVLAVPAFAIKQWGLPAGVFWGAAAGALVYQVAVYSMKLFMKGR